MKRSSMLLLALFIAGAASAQSNKRLSAINYLNAYYSYKELDKLPKAKAAIDEATVHAETSGDAKTWIYRGKIYQAIFEQKLKEELDKQEKLIQDAGRRNNAAYFNVNADELGTAMEAYMKERELDPKKYFYEEGKQKMTECMTHFHSKGISTYNEKQFANALPFYMKAIEAGKFLQMTDTMLYHDAALTAERGAVYDQAKMLYEKLIEMKYRQGATYSSLADIYFTVKDSAGALGVVKRGRAAYPDDLNLLIAETNFYLRSGKMSEAEANLKMAVEKSPNNPQLYYTLGNIYDNLGNPKNDKGKDLEKPKDYEVQVGKAENYYKKAIALDTNYFDAIYNLGALYNNHGVAIMVASDKITDQAKNAKENARAQEEFKKALPYLEKCLRIEPKDKPTMYALRQLYARTGQTEKLQKINEMIKN